jgi:hypothetical protein
VKRMLVVVCLITAGAIGSAQEGTVVGDFTKSPTEHIINQIETPFQVASVRGVIAREGGFEEPLGGVLFEIQGPGSDKRIRRCNTDERGQFRIPHVPAGTYKFKTTLSGFQSVMGAIVISKKSEKINVIRIKLHVGV